MVFIFLIGMGIWYLIYSIVCRKKVTIYSKYNIAQYIIIDKENFLKTQLCIGIINVAFLFVSAVTGYVYYLKNRDAFAYMIVAPCPLIFNLINYILVQYSVKKGYLAKEK